MELFLYQCIPKFSNCIKEVCNNKKFNRKCFSITKFLAQNGRQQKFLQKDDPIPKFCTCIKKYGKTKNSAESVGLYQNLLPKKVGNKIFCKQMSLYPSLALASKK